MKQRFVITLINEQGLQVRQIKTAFNNAHAFYAYVKSVIRTLNDGELSRQEFLNKDTAYATTNNHIIIIHHLTHGSK